MLHSVGVPWWDRVSLQYIFSSNDIVTLMFCKQSWYLSKKTRNVIFWLLITTSVYFVKSNWAWNLLMFVTILQIKYFILLHIKSLRMVLIKNYLNHMKGSCGHKVSLVSFFFLKREYVYLFLLFFLRDIICTYVI